MKQINMICLIYIISDITSIDKDYTIKSQIKQTIQQPICMSYMRVDDIEGARPRIRHAPRSLIREQKVSQQHNISYGTSPYDYNAPYSNPNNNQYYQYPYNKTKDLQPRPASNNTYSNINQYPSTNMQPIPHQPITAYTNTKNGRGYLNEVNLSQSFLEQSPVYNSKLASDSNVVRYGDSNSNNFGGDRDDAYRKPDRVERPYIFPKDAPVVNYDQYKEVPVSDRNKKMVSTYNRAFGDNHKQYLDIYQKQQQLLQNNRQNQPSKPINPNIQPDISKRRSLSSAITSSKQMPEVPDTHKEAEQKNIFRGLGYNIITNTKFSYDMENNLKSSNSKWLQ